MTDRTITPTGSEWMATDYHMAPARLRGPLLVASGIVARSDDPTDIDQLRLGIESSFDHLDAVLAEAGATWAHVIEIRSFHVDIDTNKDLYLEIKNRRVGHPVPAWTAVGVDRLWTIESRIETAVTAIVPSP